MAKNNHSKEVKLENGRSVEVTNHQRAGERWWSCEGKAYDSHQEMMEDLNNEPSKDEKSS